MVAVLDVVEAEAGVGVDAAAHGDFLVELILLFGSGEVDLEGGAFVFFHADGGAAVVAFEAEGAVEQVGGDDERAVEGTVVVGGEAGRGDLLPVGVLEPYLLVELGGQSLPSVVVMHGDTFEVDGLSGTVDGAVGEELDLVVGVVGTALAGHVLLILRDKHVVALAEGDIEAVVSDFVGEHHLAVAVRLHGGHPFGLVFAFLIVVFAACDLHGDAFQWVSSLAVGGDEGKEVGLAVDDVAELAHLEEDVEHLRVVVLDAGVGLAYKEVAAFLKRGQGDDGGMGEVVALGGEVEGLFDHGFLLVEGFVEIFVVEAAQLVHFRLLDLDDFVIGVFNVAVFQHHGDVLVRQLDLVEAELEVGVGNVGEGVFAGPAVVGVFLDGFLAELGGDAVVVAVAAVVGVVSVLFDEVDGEAVDEFGVLFALLVVGHQRAHGLLVFVVVAVDAVDELIAFVVVEEADVAFVFGDEGLEELEALDDGSVAVAEVGFDEVIGFEPPELGVPLGQDVVGVGGFAIVFHHAVEHEVEKGLLVFDVIVFGIFEEAEVVFGLGVTEGLHGFKSFGVVLGDEILEGAAVPVFHGHVVEAAVDGEVFPDAVFVVVEVLGIEVGDLFVEQGLFGLVEAVELGQGILEVGLFGLFLNGFEHHLAAIEDGLQELHLVTFFHGFLFDGV